MSSFGDDQCDPVVIAAMVVPVSNGQLTFGDDVLNELSEFGLPVMFPGGHAILG